MIKEFLEKYGLSDVKEFAVAVSGGADSLALVLMMGVSCVNRALSWRRSIKD